MKNKKGIGILFGLFVLILLIVILYGFTYFLLPGVFDKLPLNGIVGIILDRINIFQGV